MSKLNPGTFKEILPAILVVLAVIYAGVVGRLEVLVLSSGIALICYGLKLPAYNSLCIVAAATFLGAYLPFGNSSELVPMGRVNEGFADKDEEFDEEEKFKTKDEEEFESDGFKAKDEEEFESEGFKSKDDEEFEGDGFKSKDDEEFEGDGFKSKDDEEFEGDGFKSKDDEEFEGDGFKSKDDEEFEGDGFKSKEDEEFEGAEGFASGPKKKRSKKVAPPPDNGSRREALELGKKYKIPSEADDEDYHLDAGTTFLNAYKSLKPDQISAMTKDTQELINTQKQLMSTLSTLKPLITDGKQMMDTFQNYFGGQGLGDMGDLSKMAEKFISK